MKALLAALALLIAVPATAADPTNMTPAGSEGRIEAAGLLVPLVERSQHVELPPLGLGRQPLVADVYDQLVDIAELAAAQRCGSWP